MKHIGMDVHSTTTHITVLSDKGKKLTAKLIPTRAPELTDFFVGIAGPKRAALEESQMADFVARIVQPMVKELIRCQPQHNRLISRSEHKYDEKDSHNLAELLRTNSLKNVYHPDWVYRGLREGVRSYWVASRDLTRAKNRLKAFFLYNGMHCQGEQVYSARHRDGYLRQLQQQGRSIELAKVYYRRLDVCRELKAEHIRILRQLMGSFRREICCLKGIPGIGSIGAYTTVAYLENGWRISNKRKLWQYCGIGIRRRESNDKGHRGASRTGNRHMKNVLLTAAASISARPLNDNALTRLWHAGLEANIATDRLRRNLARKIAVIAQHLLRYKEEYADEQVVMMS